MMSWLPRPTARPPATVDSTRAAPPDVMDTSSVRSLVGGRLSLDTSDVYLGATNVILPPATPEDTWRLADLDSDALSRYTPAQLLQLLADLSPEVSRALFDFLRLMNPGYTAVALRPGSEEQDARGQVALDGFLNLLKDHYGTVDVVINRLCMAGYLRGAFMAELVLDKAGRLPVDLVTPDPDSARFQRQLDPVRGTIWQLGQYQVRGFVPLDRPTVRYIPVDPFPGSPYGRPLAAPAVFTSLFLLGLLHDLRRVVAQQGYPRIDVSVDITRLKQIMPAQAAADPKAFMAWTAAVFSDIKSAYNAMEPDDAFVHEDMVTINRPVGTVDSSSLGAIDGLIEGLERMATRALKTMPLMMATTDGVSEANANRQWELMAAGIKSLQHHCETLLERLLTLGLQAQGIPALVQWRFAELRASEMLRDEQTRALRTTNTVAEYAAGWISQDEAALATVGHPADVPQPRAWPKGEIVEGQSAPGAVQADPGSNRSVPLRVVGEA